MEDLKVGDIVRVIPSWIAELRRSGHSMMFEPYMGPLCLFKIAREINSDRVYIVPLGKDWPEFSFSKHILVRDKFIEAARAAIRNADAEGK